MEVSQYRASLTYGFLNLKRVYFDFDMLAWFILYQDYVWEFDEIGKQQPEKLMTQLLVSASKSYAIKTGTVFNMTLDKLVKILENSKTADSERLKTIFTQRSKSIPVEIAEKVGNGGSQKKK